MRRPAWLIGALAGLAVCYLFGALCAWDMNPGHWSTFWRLWCLCWAIIWAIGLAVSAHAVANDR